MFVHRKPFQPSLMFVGKARSLPESGVLFGCSTQVGYSLTHKHQSRLERLARDKHSSLLRTFVNYGRKKFYNVDPMGPNVIKLFTVVIYRHSMVIQSFCVIKQHYLGNYCRMAVNDHRNNYNIVLTLE